MRWPPSRLKNSRRRRGDSPTAQRRRLGRTVFVSTRSIAAPVRPSRVRWLPTFNLLIRKSSFDQAGGFDEGLATCEDCDLSYRLTALGHLIYDPDAKAAHHGESQTLGELFRREAWRSQGNLRVALTRLSDWRNWASLAAPPTVVGAFLGAILTGALALLGYPALWKWSLALLAISLLSFFTLLARVVRAVPPRTIPLVMVVFAVFVAGRAAGLVLSVPRVARRTP